MHSADRSAVMQVSSPALHQRVELELLLLAARLALDPPGAERFRQLLAQPIDWDVVIRSARHHRVVPLVYRTLAAAGAGCVPDDVIGRLQAESRMNAHRSLLLTAELVRVVDALAEHDIPTLPYKGPTLAAFVFGDVSRRQYADLDVIVRDTDITRATDVLVSRGYRVERDITGKDVGLFHPQFGVTLEMHWTIAAEHHSVQIPPGRLWEHLQRRPLAGRPMLAHAPEDLLWMLCIHGAQHRWERLSWVCDVAELVRGQPIDWSRAVESAIDLGAGRTLFLGLVLARDLLGAELPSNVVRAIESDRTLLALVEQVKQWVLHPDEHRPSLGDTERYFVALGERLGDRLRIAFRQATPYLAPTARDKEMLRLPRSLAWLLYVLRPVRLARSYGMKPLRRLFKGLFES